MPTAFITGLRDLAHNLRAIPNTIGIHPWSVDLVVESWSGDYVGEGTRTQTVTPLTHANGTAPRVKVNNNKRMMLGVADSGIYEVGPFTPVAGVSWANLTQSSLSSNQTAKVRLTHAESGEVKWCVIEQSVSEKSLSVTLTVREEAAK